MTKKYYQQNKSNIAVKAKARRRLDAEKNRARKRAYYTLNRTNLIEKQKKYAAENSDRISASAKAYAQEHRLELNAYRLKRIHGDPVIAEQHRQMKRRWRKSNPHYGKQWADENADKMREYRRKWEAGNKAKKRELYQQYRARLVSASINDSADKFYALVRSMAQVSCYYCGKTMSGKDAHIDHVIALAKGGPHCSSNLCASCPECNYKKSAKLPSQITHVPQPLLDL